MAIGNEAGKSAQGNNSVAIGSYAGKLCQGNNCIAIGSNAGSNIQENGSIIIGNNSGVEDMGTNSIILGNNTACTQTNSFVLNVSGQSFTPGTQGVYVWKGDTSGGIQGQYLGIGVQGEFRYMLFNPTTGEIIYSIT